MRHFQSFPADPGSNHAHATTPPPLVTLPIEAIGCPCAKLGLCSQCSKLSLAHSDPSRPWPCNDALASPILVIRHIPLLPLSSLPALAEKKAHQTVSSVVNCSNEPSLRLTRVRCQRHPVWPRLEDTGGSTGVLSEE